MYSQCYNDKNVCAVLIFELFPVVVSCLAPLWLISVSLVNVYLYMDWCTKVFGSRDAELNRGLLTTQTSEDSVQFTSYVAYVRCGTQLNPPLNCKSTFLPLTVEMFV